MPYPYPCGTDGQPPCPPIECVAVLNKLSAEDQGTLWEYVETVHKGASEKAAKKKAE